MPRSIQEIFDHADQLAERFENYEPEAGDERPVEEYLLERAALAWAPTSSTANAFSPDVYGPISRRSHASSTGPAPPCAPVGTQTSHPSSRRAD